MGITKQSAPTAKAANQRPGVKKGVKGFLKGRSGNISGRPAGCRSRTTLMAQEMFDENGQAIVEKIIGLALKNGDLAALKVCIERLLPPLRSRLAHFPLPEIKTAQDIFTAHVAVLQAVSQGRLTPDEATSISTVLEAMRRASDTTDLNDRVTRIEDRLEAEL